MRIRPWHVTGSIVATLAMTAAVLVPPASASAGQLPTITEPYVASSLLVGFVPGTPAADRASARVAAGAVASAPLSPLARNSEVLELAPGRGVPQAMAALAKNPNVRYAEPNYILHHEATSDDPYFTNGSLWGMYGDASSAPLTTNAYGSQAAEAWDAGQTGSTSTYVVVIDEGAQYAHPDLDANFWTNPFDAVDGVDNDGNGYVDDVHGWDFNGNDNTTYDGTQDDHGTHVSGTIGAEGGNGTGVAGVNWAVTLISAKFLGANGGTIANAVKATDYATALKVQHGLNIVATSNSWGGGGFSQSLLDAINRGGDQNILFVAAAGNSGGNNDTTASYPSNYVCTTPTRQWDCMVAVAAIDKTGALAYFSQYGATTVDLGAPGVSVTSTLPVGTYGSYSGTSMATPHVSGALALCNSMGTSAATRLVGKPLRDALLAAATATPTASLNGKTVTGGRLNVGAMVATCSGGTVTGPTITGFAPTSGTAGTIVTITGTGFTSPASVSFNGVPATTVSVDSATQISATAPVATTGPLVVNVSGATLYPGTFTYPASKPEAPTNVTARLVTKNQASVTWTKSASGDVTSQTVKVYVGTGSTPTQSFTGLAPSTQSLKVAGLKRGTTYYFSVTAISPGGSSESTKSAALKT